MAEKNTKGRFLIAFGAMLIAAALSLVIYNCLVERSAEKKMNDALAQLKEMIPDEPEQTDSDDFFDSLGGNAADKNPAEGDAVKELDGNLYIGILSIPSVDIELPVLKDWSYENLDIAPCRFYGSRATGDMIIAAHNYSEFFQRIDELNVGDAIYFKDISGITYKYEVAYFQLINGYDEASMLSGTDDWDLTLFTCTWIGRERVTVRAVMDR